MQQRVARNAKSFPFLPNEPVLVGFSGGPDSLCLAATLSALAPALRIQPMLLHVDHRLRPTSADNALRARQIADRLGLPCIVAVLPDDLTALHPHVGVEEAARRERYLAFAQAAEPVGARRIALGHHLRDQAETVLMHLFRGAGADGLGGMRPFTSMAIPWWTADPQRRFALDIWRPLLDESKEAIDACVAALGIAPIIDESNAADEFTRNRMRHAALPAIEAVYPRAQAAIGRAATIAREESDYLAELTRRALVEARDGGRGLAIETLRAQPGALQRRMVRAWLGEEAPWADLTHERVEATLELALSGREGAMVEVATGQSATIIRERVMVGSRQRLLDAAWEAFPGPRLDEPGLLPAAISIGAPLRCGSVTLLLRNEVAGGDASPDQCTTIRGVVEPLLVRLLQPGDRWSGSGGLVRESLRRAHVPVLLRDRIACIAGASGVHAAPGVERPSSVYGGARLTLCWRFDS